MEVIFRLSTSWALVASIQPPDFTELAHATDAQAVFGEPSLAARRQALHHYVGHFPIGSGTGGWVETVAL
jgi:hypothetical protein